MYVMGLFEFKEYLQASQYLEEANREYQIFTRRGYADIYPTRINYDYGMKKMFKESMDVANYVIWLIESKEILEKDRQFWQRRLQALQKAVALLTPEEQEVLRLFQEGKAMSRRITEPVLLKVKDQLEKTVDASPELKEKSLHDETEEEYGQLA